MKRGSLLSLVFVSVLLTGYSTVPARSDDEEDIREAAFRWELERLASPRDEVHFLALLSDDGTKLQDPSDKFLARFAGQEVPVRKVSDCTRSASEGVREKETGRRGRLFKVGKVVRLGESEADVEGEYYFNGTSAGGYTLRVARVKGLWVVTKSKREWVS